MPPSPKLFIVGCPRSGTSWVTTLIAGHPDVVMVPIETHIYRLIYEPFLELPTWDYHQRLRSWKGILRRYGLKPLLLGLQPADIWRGILRDYQILNHPDSYGLHALADYDDLKAFIKTVKPGNELEQAEDLIAHLFDLFLKRHGRPGQTLLEKTPMHIRYADRILRRFPEARIIEVIRDGRDVCASYNALAQQQAWARVGTAGAIRQWKRCVTWGEQFRAQAEFASRMHVVRYEALKADTTTSLQQIFNFAQLDYTSKQITNIVAAADISRIKERGEGQYIRKGIVGDWKHQLSESEVALCQEIAGKQLMQLGYS
ncbi:MAG: sulfotransferase [Cyanobacteria bacterium P01_A01_bin.123]